MNFLDVMRKDLRVLFRDRTALVFIFAMPLMFTLTFGLMFSGRSSDDSGRGTIRVLVVNQDTGSIGKEFVAALGKVGLKVEEQAGGAEIVNERVRSGDRPLGIVIPPDFSAQLTQAVQARVSGNKASQTQMHLQVLKDPAQEEAAGMARGAIQAATQRAIAPLYRDAMLAQVPEQYRDYARQMLGGGQNHDGSEPSSPVALDMIAVTDNRNADMMAYQTASIGNRMIPGYAVWFGFFLANGVAVALITERQEGTLRRMLCAPVPRGQVLFGKLMARGFMGVLQFLLLALTGVAMLHFTPGGSPFGVALTALATIFTATGLGLLIASFGKTMEQIQGMTTMLLLLMGIISGCLVPRIFMPETMQKLSLITPHAWALNAYQDLLLRNRPLLATMPNILVVCLFGLAFYGLALTRFRYE